MGEWEEVVRPDLVRVMVMNVLSSGSLAGYSDPETKLMMALEA